MTSSGIEDANKIFSTGIIKFLPSRRTTIFPLMVKLKIQQYPMNLLFLIQLCLKYNLSCYVPFLP